jgi:RNA polymerase sigma-70 factor (ECF subfamily)
MENRTLSILEESSAPPPDDKNTPPLSATHFNGVTRDVVEALIRGDHRAFDTIYLRCFEPIRGFFGAIIRNEAQAEELCQELFARLWEKRDSIDPKLNFKSFLYTVAKTAALKHLRHRRVVERYEGYCQTADPGLVFAPDQSIVAHELGMMIDLSIDRMPHQRRAVFEMSRVERLSNSEIAIRLGIRESTVRAHLHNAIMELKELLTVMLIFITFV